MRNLFKVFSFILVVSLVVSTTISQPMSGSYSVGSGQTFTTLTGAGGFFAAVNARGLNGNVTALITSDITETGANALNQWAGTYTMTIAPSAGSLRTLSGSVAGSMINLNGADKVTIDGRFAGSGKYLTFRNTNTSNTTLNLQNDARRNTFTYCTFEGSSTAGLGVNGTIVIGGTTGAQGNDSNTFSYCDIRDRSDAVGQPINAFFASGTTTTANTFNDYNTITNCNFYNSFNSANTFVDLYIIDGNANWTVSNNSFYQTSTRNPSSAGAYFGMIMATTGSNNLITGNYFGGRAPACAGLPLTLTSGAGVFGFRIFQAGTGTATTVSNNTIANIDMTLNASGNYFFFHGIESNYSGNINITGNTIGSMSATNSIIIRYSGASGNPYPSAICHGYYWGGTSTVTGSVTNNNIGGITLTPIGNTTGVMTFTGIIAGFGTAYFATSVNISGNTIGGNIANSIQNVMNVSTLFVGICVNDNSPAAVTVTNNTIRNLTDATTNSAAVLRGIAYDGTGSFTATGNTITGLSTTSTNAAGVTGNSTSNSVAGILASNISTGTINISSNTLSALRSATTSAVNTSAKGIAILGASTSVTVNGNKMYDITNSATGAGPAIYGLYYAAGTINTTNNMVAITNGEASDHPVVIDPIPGNNSTSRPDEFSNKGPKTTGFDATGSPILTPSELEGTSNAVNNNGEFDSFNAMTIQGIRNESGSAGLVYYNTVYIGGSANTGSILTSAFSRDGTAGTITLKDNLFYNGRTGNGSHYAVSNNIVGGTFTSNYNVFISANANTLARWNGTDRTIAQWRTSSAGDNQSWSTTSATIVSTNLFNNLSTGDLKINTSNAAGWIVSGKGVAIAAVNSDIEGNSRPSTITAGTSDIGADELTATPPTNPSAIVDNAPGSGVTSTYSLYGRTIAIINWGTGGTSYPSSVNIQYYSGVSPAGVLGGNYSNSYWSVVPTGTLSGTTYDITYVFGDNETFTITSPNLNTRLAKYNTSWEVFSTTGTGVYQSELNWAGFTIKSRGMYNFSTYALTDVTSPLPVSMLYFNAAALNRSVSLRWATSWEINNRGFDIERRASQKNSTSFSSWQKIGFIDGKGTTNTETQYSYTDDKLYSGSYQYRLKQVDFNGNFEYFDLNSPTNVVIGTPISFDVMQNYPNPSNPKSKIDFQIPFDAKVSIRVYDITGREVAVLMNDIKEAGFYTSEFDGSNLSSGVYFYRLVAEGNGQKFTDTKKMILVK